MDLKTVEDKEIEKWDSQNTAYNETFSEFEKGSKKEKDQTMAKNENRDDMLASILKDLELATVSLKSTSHLLEDSSNFQEEKEIKCGLNSDSQLTEINFEQSISHSQGTNEHSSNYTLDHHKVIETSSQSSLHPPTLRDESFGSLSNLQKDTEPCKGSDSNDASIKEAQRKSDSEDVKRKNINPENVQCETQKNTALRIPLPTSNPFINFIQDFRAKYDGDDITPTVLAALASAQWQKLSKDEKQLYKHVKKNSKEKNKQVERIKKYIKSLNISENAIFSKTF